MENTDAPGVRGEPGERRASGRGRDSPDAHFFFADVHQLTCASHLRNMPKPIITHKTNHVSKVDHMRETHDS